MSLTSAIDFFCYLKIKKCLNVTRGVGKSYRENGGEKFITANTTLQVKRKSATEHTG